MRVIQLPNGKRPLEFVSGLSWHPLVPDNFKKELTPLSLDMGMDLFVYRKSGKSIIGLAKSSDDVKVGQYPIALVIAQAIESESAAQNALIAVSLPDDRQTYLYVSIRDGFILADGDATGTEDQIQSRMLSDLSVDGWDLLICPEHWRVNTSTERSLDSFLPKVSGKIKLPTAWRLKPTRIAWQKTVLQLALMAVLVGGCTYAYKTWERNEEIKRQALIEAQRIAELESQRQAKLQRSPWPSIVKSAAFAHACESAIERTGLVAVNWKFIEFTCEKNELTVRWQRLGSSAYISHFKSLRPTAVISDDGATATVTASLNLAVKGVKDDTERAPNLVQRMDYLRDLENRYGMTVSLKPEQKPVVDAAIEQDSPRWIEVAVTASTRLRISTASQLMDAPAYRLQKVAGSMNAGVFKYQLTGVQYAMP